MKLLNLGCGNTYHNDWLNIDFISRSEIVKCYNLLNGIPLEENSVDVVYHSHVLEHFTKDDADFFISECFRVLKQTGIIRIAVPDFEILAREYIKNLDLAFEGDLEAERNYEWITMEIFDQMVRNRSGGAIISYLGNPKLENEDYVYKRWGLEAKNLRSNLLRQKIKVVDSNSPIKSSPNFFKKLKSKLKKMVLNLTGITEDKLSPEEKTALAIGKFRMGGEIHQWMYDKYSLKKLLFKVGFRDIEIKDGFSSDIPNWEKYQLDSVDGVVRKPDSVFIEARKL